MSQPKITFGIIALNAQPLLEYNLRALYPHAHQIIVVEGAVKIAASLARSDGHSTDDTLEMLRRFQKEQDPQSKLVIVTAADEGHADGFWPEKDEMSQAYAKRATGDWLWQVDSDEFYRPEDMDAVLELLQADKELAGLSFPYVEFFGGFDYLITGKWHIQQYPLLPRVFRWGPGFAYAGHRPPTVLNANGQDLRTLKWESAPKRDGRPIHMLHYSYVFPKQAQQKVGYYSAVTWTDSFRDNQRWYEKSYLALENPLFLGEKGWPILQWLERFRGEHPPAIHALRADLAKGEVTETQRSTQDIERLLRASWYWLTTRVLRTVMPLYWALQKAMYQKGEA
ncbi:MAG: glycosyltransferase family 2 protein [Anaerolineales bacterium]|nr:glycosyltransferase family 2 protein [Anaerolineales bacterium]